ncbi:MAG: pro-sigmaK processing inhibitor BofA family protein [Clostridiales bacterium]|jgi:hypothetical protein|nr:pro-sigmaK processing inhibitor BofA family protein [Clostridiales bacterium]
MESSQWIGWMIAACAAFVLFLFFYKALFKLLKFVLRGAFGLLGFMLCNTALAAMGFPVMVGVNALTFAFVAVLGIPGFISLYAVQWALR